MLFLLHRKRLRVPSCSVMSSTESFVLRHHQGRLLSRRKLLLMRRIELLRMLEIMMLLLLLQKLLRMHSESMLLLLQLLLLHHKHLLLLMMRMLLQLLLVLVLLLEAVQLTDLVRMRIERRKRRPVTDNSGSVSHHLRHPANHPIALVTSEELPMRTI